MNVSIIIRTFNEEKMIGNCLDKIFSQDFDKDFEVIIVDSNSQDDTVKIAKEYNIKIIELPKNVFSFGKGLNYGIKFSKGEYIVSISAHAIPHDNNWLEILCRNFANPLVAGVYGKQIPVEDANPCVRRDMSIFFGNEKIVKNDIKNLKFSNANSAIRREVWEDILFDEKMGGSEDLDWAKRAISKRYKIVYEPEAIVYHSHNENLRQVYKRSLREFKANNEIIGHGFIFLLLFGTPVTITKDILFLMKEGGLKYMPYTFSYRLVERLGILKSLI
jgi:rhamnosyltransferase